MKVVKERTNAQETAYKEAYRRGRNFKSKLDALITLENKRVKEQERQDDRPSFSSGYWNCVTGTATITNTCCSGFMTDIDNRPDFRPDKNINS